MEIFLLVVIALLIGFIAFVLFGYGVIGAHLVSTKVSLLKTTLKKKPYWDERERIWQFGAYIKTDFGNKKHGEWYNCHLDGEFEIFNYDKGVTEGVYQKFNEHKEIIEEGTLTGEIVIDALPISTRIGEWKSYHSNGRLESTGKYSSGKKDGKWSFYDENTGNLRRIITFKSGKETDRQEIF